MTAFFDSAKAIITRFDTVWAAAHAGFPIVHDNQHYEPIEGSDFVYISVQFTGANAISLGGPDTSLIRHTSLLEINFYTALAKWLGKEMIALSSPYPTNYLVETLKRENGLAAPI